MLDIDQILWTQKLQKNLGLVIFDTWNMPKKAVKVGWISSGRSVQAFIVEK